MAKRLSGNLVGGSGGGSIQDLDDLSDVDTSTVAPTDGQALVWDNANSQWEPGTVSGGSGTTLPSANDGEALIYENGAWVAGPVIGGVNYTPGGATSNSTVPTGFSIWDNAWGSPAAANITLSNFDRTGTANNSSEKLVWSPTAKSSGKWYVEFALGNISTDMVVGLSQTNNNTIPGISPSTGFGIRQGGGSFNQLSGATFDSGYSSTWGYSNYIMIAVDFDAKYFWFGVNGTWQNSGDPAAGTGYVVSNWSGTPSYYVGVRLYNANESATWEAYNATNITIPAADSLRTLLGIGEYADDTAAGTGGLSSGELYYNTTSSSYVLKS